MPLLPNHPAKNEKTVTRFRARLSRNGKPDWRTPGKLEGCMSLPVVAAGATPKSATSAMA